MVATRIGGHVDGTLTDMVCRMQGYDHGSVGSIPWSLYCGAMYDGEVPAGAFNEAENSEHVVGRSDCPECIESIFRYRGGVAVGGGAAAAVLPSSGSPDLRRVQGEDGGCAANAASPVSLSLVP